MNMIVGMILIVLLIGVFPLAVIWRQVWEDDQWAKGRRDLWGGENLPEYDDE